MAPELSFFAVFSIGPCSVSLFESFTTPALLQLSASTRNSELKELIREHVRAEGCIRPVDVVAGHHVQLLRRLVRHTEPFTIQGHTGGSFAYGEYSGCATRLVLPPGVCDLQGQGLTGPDPRGCSEAGRAQASGANCPLPSPPQRKNLTLVGQEGIVLEGCPYSW